MPSGNRVPALAIRAAGGVLLTLVAGLALWTASDPAPLTAIWSLIAATGAVLCMVLVGRYPAAAFGVLLLLASISRPTVELPLGSMRMEQPAIAVTALVLLFTRWRAIWEAVRASAPVVGAFFVYLAVLAASSLFVAPDPLGSLRLVLWTAVSMVGGLAAYILLRPLPISSGPWFRLAGVCAAAVGIAMGILFLIAGPDLVELQDDRKVYAYFWEANLYASFLVLTTPFALDAVRERPTVARAAVALLILVGFALGLTRGAYLGLTVGLTAYFGLLLVRGDRLRSLLPAGTLAAAGIALGYAATAILLPPVQPVPTGTTSAPVTATPETPVKTTPLPKPTSTPRAIESTSDTVAFRLERVPVALNDVGTSPVIGLGADSFGQRHLDPTQGNQPDHTAIMAVAVVYETGVVGSVALAFGFTLLIWWLFRATARPRRSHYAAACLAALLSVLAAYQATNGLHFALTWLLVGACLAVARPGRADEQSGA